MIHGNDDIEDDDDMGCVENLDSLYGGWLEIEMEVLGLLDLLLNMINNSVIKISITGDVNLHMSDNIRPNVFYIKSKNIFVCPDTKNSNLLAQYSLLLYCFVLYRSVVQLILLLGKFW